MLDGPTVVTRILSMGHPDLVDATLMSRSQTAGVDGFTSVAWKAIEQPTNKMMALASGIQDTNETANFQLLKESQSVEPKVGDRLTIIGLNWNVKSVRPRLQAYVFDLFCVRDAS